MKLIITLAVLVTVAVALPRSPAVPVKDILSRNSKIVGGSPAKEGQFPWQVVNKFEVVGGRSSFCGGSLISTRWVLTAAHCAVDAYSFEITLGTLYFYPTNESGRVVVNTTKAIVHDLYSSLTLNNDIALVDLVNDITPTDTIQPITLGRTYHEAGAELTVSGWGKTSDNGPTVSNTLNFVKLVTISNDDCRDVYDEVNDEVLCCVRDNEHSACSGDSGGPLMEQQSNDFVHVGVLSFGHILGCENSFPNGFTRTASYLDWIKENSGVE